MRSVAETYLHWLRNNMTVSSYGDIQEITTPFLDRHNDHLQFYVLPTSSGYRLSDEGYILSDLSASGFDLNSPKRKDILNTTLNGFGVRQENGELVVDATSENLPQRMHFITQAMLAVNDMFVLSQPRVAGYFFDDVKEFLVSKEILHVDKVKITGKSGYDHLIDFVVPKSPKSPEKIIQAINNPSKNTIAAYLFALTDTTQARDNDTMAFAFLNDAKMPISSDVSSALTEYSVTPIRWSKREEIVPRLTVH